MAAYATKEDKRLRHVKHKQDSKYQRGLFIKGKAGHIGFIFFVSHVGNTFHIIRNNDETYCGKRIYEETRKCQNEIIIVKKLSDVNDQEIKNRPIKNRELCWMCENIFLGLYKGEKFKKHLHLDHVNIFNIPDDSLYVDHYLVDLLINPRWKFLPRLESLSEIQALPYDIKLVNLKHRRRSNNLPKKQFKRSTYAKP